MNNFLKTLATFASIFLLYTMVMYAVNWAIIEVREPEFAGKNTLIAGDSHVVFALDPKLMHSAANIGQTSEPYYATYWKLKEILKANPIDTVLLSFSYNNLSAVNDKKFVDPMYADKMFSRLYPIAEFDKLKGVEIDRMSFYKTKFEQMCLYPIFNHNKYIGNFIRGERNDISDYEWVISQHYYHNDQLLGVSDRTIQYMDSIRTLCERKNARLILVSPPLCKEYLTRVPEVVVSKYEEVKQIMQSKGVPVLDYGHADYDQSYYYNADHLNGKGAEVFTREIVARLASMSNMPEGQLVVKQSGGLLD